MLCWQRFAAHPPRAAGKFYRHKSPNHPHTNMAKAALNMMTRTSAADYAESNIYMTAVRNTQFALRRQCVCLTLTVFCLAG